MNWLDMHNRENEHVKGIFVPCYLDGKDGIFNMHYYDLLLGLDLTVYPSYYEPWGYTPLESVAFKSSRADNYVHIMKYDIGGKTYEVQDKAGYTQPLKVGSTHLILCDPKEPEKFKFEEDVTKHITIAGALVAMAVVFAGRFIYSYLH